ncbi:putative multidrug resistance ABC transporter ATP-binding/permease protein YheH [Thalassobacillus devorans]|uniref:Multidrug resistance ABC transporter ATP-binding/permease protein YheH n=2 Tax=Thalassobacillus devorans TaxID=279813 RepID=A0ABQ1PSK8_9BACI|nr:ATP-binding cassette subfamily B protein [Thalassobacillus devorans]GGD02706.1 putative multidrug resistance ABC transporter ATP-binding/permease protein YheH [Thalassobacillus devorans]
MKAGHKTEKKLFHYAWMFRKPISIGLICLVLAVALELTGPFIAKRLIDQHVVGIESTWHQVKSEDDYTVAYQGDIYKREDRLGRSETTDNPATILQVGSSYYFVDQAVPTTGKREVEGDTLTIQTPDEKLSAQAEKLSLTELYRFFEPERPAIYRLLGLYVGLLLIAAVFQFWNTFLLQRTSNRIIQQMREDVFAHIQRLPISYFINQPAGKVVARVTNDTEAIRELYVRVLATFVTSFVYMTGIYIALFLLDVRLAVMCLLLVPIIAIWMGVYKYFGGKYNKVVRSTVSDMNGNINEAIQCMSIIQAFRRQRQTSEEFEALNSKHFIYQKKLIRLSALTSHNLVNVLRNLAFVAFIWYFGSQSISAQGVITIGVLYAFVDYLTRLFQPVNDLVNQLPQLEQARVAAGRVFEMLEEEGEDVKDSKVPRYKGHVRFEHVSFAYEKDEYILKDIDFEVAAGQTAAFVGHTGSGKSSIMNLLFRFYDPQKGTITIDGQDTKDWSRQQVRSHMGIVLQDPFLFTGTILSNVTMNDPNISREMAIRALKAVGADRFIKKLPNQYDEPVKEKGSSFSMGERQLISFARALAFDPAILILDEATANIDTETEKLIQNALQVLKQGRTTLVIAHRLSTIQQADQIFVLQHGTMMEKGTHAQLLAEEGLYYQMYQMQQGKVKAAAM